MNERWSEEEKCLLINLYYQGLYLKDISCILNRSFDSIKTKVYRLGISNKRDHYSLRMGFSKDHLNNLSLSRKKLMSTNPDILEKMIAGIRDYHKDRSEYPSTWNKGMKPWEWMNITEDYFHKIATSKSSNKPTSIEVRFIKLCKECKLPYRYVGDFQVWINGKNPDFINTSGEKKIIELFGNYWHKPEDENTLTDHYGKYGFKTLIIWEDELKNLSDDELINVVKKF